LRLNAIGCTKEECRPSYKALLREAVQPHLAELCGTCQRRFETNILRIFDCKADCCRKIAETLPKTYEHLCPECAEHFEAVKESLDAAGCEPNIDGALVRGLDYYTKTVFEFTHPALGAQDAIAGGGRYDGLVEQLGGKPTPAAGFAAGIERVMMAMEASPTQCRCAIPLMVYGIAADASCRKALTGLLARLRDAGLSADMSFDVPPRSVKAQMRQANARNTLVCLILGENELSNGEAAVKDMREGGEQKNVPLDGYVEYILRLLMR
jgi:histidyl-tRNA synthetase